MVRKIVERVPGDVLRQDLEKYRQRAIELGAIDARIITTDMVIIDERVRAKCLYPKCPSFGSSAHCPPHGMDLDMTAKVVKNFRYAIFTMMKTTPEDILFRNLEDRRLAPPSQLKNYEIVGRIEAEAFFDGYHLAVGFADGPCKRVFCPLDDKCSALIPGQSCRHPLRARSSMEAVGMNAYMMATKAGWDIYPIGRCSSPSDVPHGTRLGLILIY